MRLHYQFFILSGSFLLGGLISPELHHPEYWLQFLNVHILLFGGATAFNSYWDKDEGPIGGLQNPPPMKPWMRDTSIWMQFAGLILAGITGWLFFTIYLISMLLFWLYSTPVARWKGSPILSLVAIGLSTGTNSVLLGSLAAGANLSLHLILAAVGAASILLSLYPVSQVFQMEEDKSRGDETFAIRYGIKGIRRFFIAAFFFGLCLIAVALLPELKFIAIGFALVGLIVWIYLSVRISRLEGNKEEYSNVMNLKFITSISFVLFLLTTLILRHSNHGIEWINHLFFE